MLAQYTGVTMFKMFLVFFHTLSIISTHFGKFPTQIFTCCTFKFLQRSQFRKLQLWSTQNVKYSHLACTIQMRNGDEVMHCEIWTVTFKEKIYVILWRSVGKCSNHIATCLGEMYSRIVSHVNFHSLCVCSAFWALEAASLPQIGPAGPHSPKCD